jgi:hypothetical protein
MTTAKRPGLRAVLARPAYRRLFAAQTISRWGDTFNTVALVVLVFRLTGSGLGVTGAVIAEIAPVLLLAPIAGAVVDRLPRVRVMIAADLWRMALAAALPLLDHRPPNQADPGCDHRYRRGRLDRHRLPRLGRRAGRRGPLPG